MTNPTMRAKMAVTNIHRFTNPRDADKVTGLQLTLSAVCKSGSYNADGTGDEDNTFSRWTPMAKLDMLVQNPALFDAFKVGQRFYVDFTEAPAA